jgi:hypothetical protein
MKHKINDRHLTSAGSSKPVTFDDAEALNPFDLTRLWGDRLAWPLNGAVSDELAELACMSALARWLNRWQPIHIHRAILVGADPAAVAAALGGSVAETFGRWHSWAAGQRDVLICGQAGVTAEEYETVERVFAAAGVTVPGGEPRP